MSRRSPYAKVNERRRKLRWNNRSTAQLNRRRSERRTDLGAAWTTERRGKRTRHGLVNTGYLASLMAEREEVLKEAREVAAQREVETLPPGVVPVSESHDGRNAPYVRAPPNAGVRAAPPSSVDTNERGEWVAGGRAFRYKSDAEDSLR